MAVAFGVSVFSVLTITRINKKFDDTVLQSKVGGSPGVLQIGGPRHGKNILKTFKVWD